MRRGTVTLLSVVTLALAVAVLVDRPRGAPALGGTERVLPGLDPARVQRVELVAPGRAAVVLARQADGALALTAPVTAAADESVVRDLLETLEYLAFRRRVAPDPARAAERGLAAPALIVTVTDAAGVRTLRVGRLEPALGRTWLEQGGQVYLVDAYAARALDRTLVDLRRRDPFRNVDDEQPIVLAAAGAPPVALHGKPACVDLPGGCARADRARVAELREALLGLRLTRFVDAGPPPTPPIATLRLGPPGRTEELAIRGACPGVPDERLVGSSLGAGCVADADAARLLARVEPLAFVARGLVASPAGLTRIEVRPAGGHEATLERRQGHWVALAEGAEPVPLDDQAVRAWLGELASFRALAVRVEPPLPGPPAGADALVLAWDGTRDVISLTSAPSVVTVRRAGEPVLLSFHPALRRAFRLDPADLRSRELLSFDGYALSAVDLESPEGRERAERGRTADEWRLTAPLALDADADVLDRLRQVASALRARRVLTSPQPFTPARVLTLTVDAPPGSAEGTPATRLRLELGPAPSPTNETCLARHDGDPALYVLGPEACAALGTHLAARSVFEVAADEVTAVTVGPARWERHGTTFYSADGAPVDGALGTALAALPRRLARADVAGYGVLAGGVPLVLEAGGTTIKLTVRGGEYVLDGRAVRYRAPRELCTVFRLCP